MQTRIKYLIGSALYVDSNYYTSIVYQAPDGCRIQASFKGPFGTYCYSEDVYPTCYQWVEVKSTQDLSSRGQRCSCKINKIKNKESAWPSITSITDE